MATAAISLASGLVSGAAKKAGNVAKKAGDMAKGAATSLGMGVKAEAVDTADSIISLWGDITSAVLDIVTNFPERFQSFLKSFAIFILCCFCIGTVGIIVAVGLYLYIYIQPRLFIATRTAGLDGWMDSRITELVDAITFLSTNLSSKSKTADWFITGRKLTPDAMCQSMKYKPNTDGSNTCDASQLSDFQANFIRVRTACNQLLKRDLAADLLSYFKYSEAVQDLGFLARYDLKSNAQEFCSEGDLDASLISDFTLNVMKPLGNLQEACEALSDTLAYTMPNFTSLPNFPIEATKVATYVHRIRMIMSYRKLIMRMYKTRRGGLPFAIWTVHYAPYIVDIFEHRIPEAWKSTPAKMARWMLDCISWWNGVGVSISLLPCTMAYNDPEKRQANCKGFQESFVANKIEDVLTRRSTPSTKLPPLDSNTTNREEFEERQAERWSEHGAREVIEGISIGGALSAIVGFVKNMKFVGQAVKTIGDGFGKDPFGAIVQLVVYFLGLILGLIIMLIFTLMTVSGSIFIIFVAVATIMTFLGTLLYTIFQILLAILIAVPFFVLWLIDLPTSGAVTAFLRCENLPDDWASIPHWVYYNGYEHIAGLFCVMPCFSRYKPVIANCFCYRTASYMPDLCPQQQISLMFLNKNIIGTPWALDKYKPQPSFYRKQMSNKLTTIASVYRNKVDWYQTCYQRLGQYEYAVRHVCSNVDRFVDSVNGTSSDKAKLTTLCKDCICDYREANMKRDGLNDRAVMTNDDEEKASYTCRRLYGLDKSDSDQDPNALSGPGVETLRKAATAGIFVVALLCIIYSLMRASNHMVSDYLQRPSSLAAFLPTLSV